MEIAKQRPDNRLVLGLPYILAITLTLVLYARTFSWWYQEWTLPGSFYAHSIFVPFFVVAMLWRNRKSLQEVLWKPSWSGLILVAPGVALLLLALRADVDTVQSLSFIFTLVGCSLLILGLPKTQKILLPLLFVVLMMPLIPDQLISGIAFPIQLKSAQLAVWMLNHITLTCHQEGVNIIMEHYRMAVELPCSGFKTLLSLMTFAAAFAYLVEAPLWKRWFLLIATAPLSLLVNGLRIALIGVVGELVSSSTAQIFHDYSGLIVLILAFTFLFNLARLLKCESFLGVPLTDEIDQKSDQNKFEESQKDNRRDVNQSVSADDFAIPSDAAIDAMVTEATSTTEQIPDKQEEGGLQEFFHALLSWRPSAQQLRATLPQVLALDLLLLFSVVGLVAIKQNSHVKTKLPIARFQVPREFTYNGVTYKCVESLLTETDTLEHGQLELLSPTRVINRDYEGSDGSRIQLFMTSGNGRRVFHDPHNCALGSDAQIIDIGPTSVFTPTETIDVQEAHYRQTIQVSKSGTTTDIRVEERELMFCYVVEGKVLQNTYQIRNALIWQTFFGDGGQPSYFVRVFQANTGIDTTKKEQLENFIAGLWSNIGPILHGTVPGQPDDAPHASRPLSERTKQEQSSKP